MPHSSNKPPVELTSQNLFEICMASIRQPLSPVKYVDPKNIPRIYVKTDFSFSSGIFKLSVDNIS